MDVEKGIKNYYLFPGNIFAEKEPHIVTTVLGSCVSVCLWDTKQNIGGINHYMLPLWNGEGLASPKYGNIAISKLIERMLSMGSIRRNLVAKIFGGGEVLHVTNGILNVGERNIILAFDTLKDEAIPVINSSVGGKNGRKILFNTSTGNILLKKLKRQIDDIKF